ncbi:hypothetical protein [Hyphomicrobium sp.]|uniref:hypothetical protein n=1 Tax=Hyphomicrobium sp. TaxID=82 RepID=UPI0035664282
MNRFVFALSAIALGIGTTSAFAASGCSGDFSRVDGRWIADPSCQRAVAQSIASTMHERIGRGPGEETHGEFCRRNGDDIRADGYCSAYKY